MLLYTMLYIVLAYLMLFAALTNSVCLNNASFFFLFKYFLCQGYELSGEIALKNNHYYYYYYYVSSHLQRIQNYAARVILRLPKSSNITTQLRSLHWLPVKERSTYKIACLFYHCHSNTVPSYVTDMLQKEPLHTRNIRSSSCIFSIDLHTVRQHLIIFLCFVQCLELYSK